MNLTSVTSFLAYAARLNPAIYDAIHPQGPVLSEGTRHVMAAMVIKSVAKQVSEPTVQQELQWLGKSLFDSGVSSMSFEFDDWCGTYVPHRFGPPHPQPGFLNFGEEVMLNPQPLPPHEDVYFGALLTVLADAVSLEKVQDALRNIGATLMKTSVEGLRVYTLEKEVVKN
jgi:hypothetical protein